MVNIYKVLTFFGLNNDTGLVNVRFAGYPVQNGLKAGSRQGADGGAEQIYFHPEFGL